MSLLLDQVLDPVRLEQCQQADRAESEHAQAQRRPVPPDPRETHYKLQAALAELSRFDGGCLIAKEGCYLARLPYCDSTAVVEYTYSPPEPQTEWEPAVAAEVEVLRVLINGHMCWATEAVPQSVYEGWCDLLIAKKDGHSRVLL